MELSSISPEIIPTLSVLSAQEKVASKAGTAMLAKTLDTQEQNGAALINMMRSSMEKTVNPSVGNQVDISI